MTSLRYQGKVYTLYAYVKSRAMAQAEGHILEDQGHSVVVRPEGGWYGVYTHVIRKNPSSYPNIDKSAFHRGEYVGYANGVWRIFRWNRTQWKAVKRDSGGVAFVARTLEEVSARLEKEAQTNTNPPLMVIGNPKGMKKNPSYFEKRRKQREEESPKPILPRMPGPIMSMNVISIRYKHFQDEKFYEHVFEKGVRMTAKPNGTIVLSHTEKPIWDDFPE